MVSFIFNIYGMAIYGNIFVDTVTYLYIFDISAWFWYN